jgi:DNA topoisomerase-6 subunit B
MEKKTVKAVTKKSKTETAGPGLFDDLAPESAPEIIETSLTKTSEKKVKAAAADTTAEKVVKVVKIVPVEIPAVTDSDESPADTPAVKGKRKRTVTYANAETMAKSQQEISVSEFFAKNRHLLGFDNPRKALLTTIKEAVDNSLDACEEAGIMPEIDVAIKQITEDRFEVTVQDNGPGIVKAQVPNIFGRLLYGSKFHQLRMSRGQQGIGISAAGMYGVLTTGQPIRVVSKTGAGKPAHYYELAIDTKKNRPDIIKEDETEFSHDHGTSVTIELEAKYQRGKTSVDEYLKQTAITNPHATFRYMPPDGVMVEFLRSTDELPPQPKAIKPHPYGVELGILIKLLQDSPDRRLKDFLVNSFSRVSANVADEIIKEAKLRPTSDAHRIGRTEADRLFQAINRVKIPPPSTDCIVPVGEESLLKGLQSIIKADFYTATTRPPAVYRGNAFVVEVALAYGKPEKNPDAGEQSELQLEDIDKQMEEFEEESTEQVRLMRFANRVPLLYQQSACATFKAMVGTNWRSYGLQQSRGSMPVGQAAVIVHIASVWVPFTSESKEAIAHYPEMIKEIRLAIQDCGRKLGRYLKRQHRVYDELKKRSYIEKYIPHIGEALKVILSLPEPQIKRVVVDLKSILERSRKL